MFDRIAERAAEIFRQNERADTGELMEGPLAWVDAVHDVIETDGDAVAAVVDIISNPHLKEVMSHWSCDGENSFAGFVRSALTGMAHYFEPAIVAKVGVNEYNAITDRRRALARG